MAETSWIDAFPGAVMFCDNEGIIVHMNALAIQNYAKDGGAALIGKNVLDCHPEPSRSKLLGLLRSHAENVYSIEKNGKHKLVYQAPWFENDQPMGIMEISLEIPAEMPHFKRD